MRRAGEATCAARSQLLAPYPLPSYKQSHDGSFFNVNDTLAINGNYSGEARPFILFAEQRDEDETAQLEKLTGWMLDQEIGLAAMCNGQQDRRILAEMALCLAQRPGAYIGLGGEVPLPAALPGRIHAISYQTASGWEAQCTILDETALAGWLEATDFRMVK